MSDIVWAADSPSFWRGTQPLWKSFWLLYVGGHVLLYALLPLVLGMTGVVRWVLGAALMPLKGTGLAVLLASVWAPFLLFWAYCWVAVWRAGRGYPVALWRWAARALLSLHGLWLLAATLYLVVMVVSVWPSLQRTGAEALRMPPRHQDRSHISVPEGMLR